MAQAATIVRVDLTWDATERVPGQYIWAPFDQLLKRLGAVGVRPYFTIDYSNIAAFPSCNTTAPNSNGPDHTGPASPGCVTAFVRFAVAAMKHLNKVSLASGTPLPIYELWNEPNTVFWGSEHGNATQYAVLASALRRGMQQANLSSTILVGPAVSGFGSQETWNYLQQLEAAGTLALFDAISAHAYRNGPPESVLADYARLSQMRGVKAMVSGEWGWSTCTPSQAPGTNCPPQARADE